MRIHTTLLIASCLTLAAYTLPGCDEGGSSTPGPRPQTTNTPSASDAAATTQSTAANTSANDAVAPNPHGGGAGSVDSSHGTIRPDASPQHPNVVTKH